MPMQPEEHEQPGHVAGHVAGFVEPRCDRIEDAAHHLGRDRHAADAIAENGSHRGQQNRRSLNGKPGIGQAEAVDPIDLRIEPDDLPEGEDDADQEHADDERIEPGIGKEGGPDLLVEHGHYERAQDQEHQHPDEENPGR